MNSWRAIMKPESLLDWSIKTVVIGLVLVSVSCFDYCTTPCTTRMQTYKHTMCLYPKETPGNLCRGLDASKDLTQEDKDLILKVHNNLRSKVAQGKETRGGPGPQPQAANMMELVWDNELETIARRWVMQCDYQHDKCRKTKAQEAVGQNIAVTYDSEGFANDLEKMVVSWYDEVELVPSRLVQSYSSTAVSGTIGHYTQLVWGETSRVGCARVYFDYSDWGPTEYLACNYAPAGNLNGAVMYNEGSPCSACGSRKCSITYPGLCGAESTADQRLPESQTEEPDSGETFRIDESFAGAGGIRGNIFSSVLTFLVVKFLTD